MSFVSRVFVVGALVTQIIASVLALIVLGSAGVLGEAALMSADDAMILFVLMGLNLLATIVIGFKVWSGGRTRKRLSRELAAYRSSSSNV